MGCSRRGPTFLQRVELLPTLSGGGAIRPSLREGRRAGCTLSSAADLSSRALQAADYSATPETVSEEDAEHTIQDGKQFLATAREYLERQ